MKIKEKDIQKFMKFTKRELIIAHIHSTHVINEIIARALVESDAIVMEGKPNRKKK